MSVQNVVLGQLIGGRGYGYELAERMKAFADAIELSDAAVYMALQGLERRGLIVEVGRDVPGRGGRRAHLRVIYDATDAGRAYFREWMASAPRKTPLREELHMQLMVAEDGDVPRLIASLRAIEHECREAVARIVAASLDVQSSSRARISPFGAPLVQSGLVAHHQATLEWAQRSRRALERRARRQETGVPGRRRP